RPSRSSPNAPRFGTSATEFKSFFNEVESLAKECGLSDKEKIEWAIRYAEREGEQWTVVDCMLEEDANPSDEQFRREVRECYPELDEKRRYTLSDLIKVIEANEACVDLSKQELGNY